MNGMCRARNGWRKEFKLMRGRKIEKKKKR